MKEQMAERLNTICSASQLPDTDYVRTAKSSDWVNYGKNRTYFKIVETRTGSKHYKEKEYGYYDNIADEYVPGKNDLRDNFTFSGERF